MQFVQRVSLFEITSQKGGIGAETPDLATLLQLHLDRNLCRDVLRSAAAPAEATNGRAEGR